MYPKINQGALLICSHGLIQVHLVDVFSPFPSPPPSFAPHFEAFPWSFHIVLLHHPSVIYFFMCPTSLAFVGKRNSGDVATLPRFSSPPCWCNIGQFHMNTHFLLPRFSTLLTILLSLWSVSYVTKDSTVFTSVGTNSMSDQVEYA